VPAETKAHLVPLVIPPGVVPTDQYGAIVPVGIATQVQPFAVYELTALAAKPTASKEPLPILLILVVEVDTVGLIK